MSGEGIYGIYCPCGCALKDIGEDVSEKLDSTLGCLRLDVFSMAGGVL